MADIRKFAVSATGRLHLRDSSDELMYADEEKIKPIAVNVFGPGSKQYAKAQAEQNNRLTDRLRKKGKSEMTAEQKAMEGANFLADCTESFENLEYEALTGRDLAKAVYMDLELGFIADQVAKFIGDWANFTKASTKA